MTDPKVCESCGDQIPSEPPPALVAAGGWCGPSETLYSVPEPQALCSDCRSRLLFASELGFDPGRNGENLRVSRGGIKFERTP